MIYLHLNAAKSSGREFADAVAKLINRYCQFDTKAKVATVGKDSYKITWWWNDNNSMAKYLSVFEDRVAIEEDNLEYDDEMKAILPSDKWKAANENKPTPEEFMRALDSSGRLRLLCLNYGFQQDKKLHFTKQREELSGSNARALAKVFGIDIRDEAAMKEFLRTDHFYHFITCYVTQNIPQYQTDNTDWIIKCLDSLFRYHKVFQGKKKIHISDEDWVRMNKSGLQFIQPVRKGNALALQKSEWSMTPSGRNKYTPVHWEGVENTLGLVQELIHKYYPEFLDHIVFDTNDSSIILEVN